MKPRAEDARLLEEMKVAFERLNNDPAERHCYDAELARVGATLLDGLEPEDEASSNETSSANI